MSNSPIQGLRLPGLRRLLNGIQVSSRPSSRHFFLPKRREDKQDLHLNPKVRRRHGRPEEPPSQVPRSDLAPWVVLEAVGCPSRPLADLKAPAALRPVPRRLSVGRVA